MHTAIVAEDLLGHQLRDPRFSVHASGPLAVGLYAKFQPPAFLHAHDMPGKGDDAVGEVHAKCPISSVKQYEVLVCAGRAGDDDADS